MKALGFTQLSLYKPAQLMLERGQAPREGDLSVLESVGQALAVPFNLVLGGRAAVSYWAVARATRRAAEQTEVVAGASPPMTPYNNLEIRKMGQT